jgi:hypothetical protein
MLRLILLFGLNSLLSAAIVAITVVQCSDVAQRVERALENPGRHGSAAAICETALKASIAFLVCGALTWRLVRHVPFG